MGGVLGVPWDWWGHHVLMSSFTAVLELSPSSQLLLVIWAPRGLSDPSSTLFWVRTPKLTSEKSGSNPITSPYPTAVGSWFSPAHHRAPAPQQVHPPNLIPQPIPVLTHGQLLAPHHWLINTFVPPYIVNRALHTAQNYSWIINHQKYLQDPKWLTPLNERIFTGNSLQGRSAE